MLHTDRWERICRGALPLLPPLSAVALLVFQQFYYPNSQADVIINILLLAFHLLAFLPAVKPRADSGQVKNFVSASFICVLALVYNVCIGEAPSPLSDFLGFLSSMCGIWVLVSAVELAGFAGLAIYRRQPPRASTPRVKPAPGGGPPGGAPAADGQNGQGPGAKGTQATPEAACVPGEGRRLSAGAKLIIVSFFVLVLLLPLILWQPAAGWMDSVRSIAAAVFGDRMQTVEPPVVIIAYIAIMFAGAVALYIVSMMVRHVLVKYSGHAGEQSDFFKEYSTPITLFIMVVIGALATRQIDLEKGLNAIDLICNLFSWALAVLVGLIALFTLFEAVRLILKQCTERGSLLKTAMHLLFTLVVEYTMGLLTGILRIFALREVIEDLLLFFLPDLEDSIEPEVNAVFKEALRNEVEESSADARGRHRAVTPPDKRKPGFRIRHRRGRR